MLAGLTVIEVGEFVAVPMCGKLLAGLGAEVIKVEPPGRGDRARAHGPFPGDEPHMERSGLFVHLNVNKAAVTLDPATEEGRGLLAGLLAQADVLVTDVPPARRAAWGLDAGGLSAAHPALVLASITPFGMTGPLRDLPGDDLLCNALSGTAWAIGEPGRAPLQMPLFQCDQQAGIAAAGAVLAALISRLRTGRGQVLDLSTADVTAAYAGTNAAIFFPYGRPFLRAGTNASGHGGPYPYAIFPCKDGHVAIIARSRTDWMKFIDSLGHPDWADDARYSDQIEISAEYAEEVDALLRPLLARRSKDELFDLAQQWGYPLAPLRTLTEALAEPQFAHRRFFADVPVEGAPPVRLPNLPYRFSGWPQPPVRPAPGLGADNARILGGPPGPHPAGAGPARRAGGALMNAAPETQGAAPLAGHRVLDLARVWSGGMIGALLSGLGAEIIKVESGDNLDVVRLVGRPLIGGHRAKGPVTELNPMYHHINRDKRGICLNLKTPRGRELLLDLARQCDIVLENFSAGVMERLGLGYETLRGVRPDVIYAAVSSAGQDGPLARMKGYAPIISSLAGLEHMVGYEGEAPLGMMNFGLCDPNAGAQATFAVLAAVYHRERTGAGQYIDMSQLEACMVLLGEAMADLSFNGRTRNPGGNAHPTCCPHGIYACRDTDTWVAVSMPEDAHWPALCALLGRADWARDSALAAAPGRLARRGEIDAALDAWCAGRTPAEAAAALTPLGIGAQPVLPVEQTHERHPHFEAHRLLQTVELPYLGPYPLYAFPWPMSAWAPAIGRAAPQLGHDTADVLRELLGLGDDELAGLRADKVINEA